MRSLLACLAVAALIGCTACSPDGGVTPVEPAAQGGAAASAPVAGSDIATPGTSAGGVLEVRTTGSPAALTVRTIHGQGRPSSPNPAEAADLRTFATQHGLPFDVVVAKYAAQEAFSAAVETLKAQAPERFVSAGLDPEVTSMGTWIRFTDEPAGLDVSDRIDLTYEATSDSGTSIDDLLRIALAAGAEASGSGHYAGQVRISRVADVQSRTDIGRVKRRS